MEEISVGLVSNLVVEPEKPQGKVKVVVGVNTLTAIDQTCYANHCQLWFHLGKLSDKFQFIFNTPRRMGIDRMRNMTAKIAVEHNADYVLFIDDDVVVPIDCLEYLLSCNADIAAGWTLIRGYPFKNMFFKFQDHDKDGQIEKKLETWESPVASEDGLFHVDAVGFSCCLIKVSLLKEVGTPYFVTGPFNTEDIYFCMKARDLKPDTKIVVHPHCITPHAIGNEFIDTTNKDFYKTYFEAMNPASLDSPKEEKPEPMEFKGQKKDDVAYEAILQEAVWGTPLPAIIEENANNT